VEKQKYPLAIVIHLPGSINLNSHVTLAQLDLNTKQFMTSNKEEEEEGKEEEM
jgi:hypothetical protein